MKNKIAIIARSLVLPALLLTFNSQLPTARAQGTAFTYQGRLNSGGGATSGSYDVQFTLYATNVTGSVIAGPVTNTAVAVTNGLFTTTLDFGAGVFTGLNCWLDLAVRTNGAATFTELSPRQALTPAPYAVFANTASNVLGSVPVTQLTGTISTNVLPGFQPPNYNTISGGNGNSAGPSYATVAGGQGNTVNNAYGVAGGGFFNTAGFAAVVPGGYNNIASGNYSFAAGEYARAVNQGAFVWADSQGTTFSSVNNDSFNVRAQGGVNFQTGNNGVSANGQPLLTNNAAGVTLSGTFSGNGAGLTNLNSAALNGLQATNFWQVGGNMGANPTNGAFLGTKDSLPLELRVNNLRAMRVEPNATSPNIIGGSPANMVSNGIYGTVYGAFIGGGGDSSSPNRVLAPYASVLGGDGNVASGNYSTAMGYGSTASGFYSTAMGNGSTASGNYSMAMGASTTATGYNATAMGASTTAGGAYSTTMGYGTQATNDYATAIGNGSMAGGNAATALGYNTTASGSSSTAMGDSTTASGIASTAMGGTTFALNDHATAMGIGTVASGHASTAMGNDTAASGYASTAMGYYTSASGTDSMAMGARTSASGLVSTAMGAFTTASGSSSTAMGTNTTAGGYGSTAMGDSTTASGTDSTAMGYNTIATNNYSTAMGYGSTASGYGSTAMGYSTTASGDFSTAMGLGTAASGGISTAMGESTTASGMDSTAMGYNSKATYDYSTAMGYSTTASGNFSTAMGLGTTASGIDSTAMGDTTTASGYASTAMGSGAQALHDYSFVWSDNSLNYGSYNLFSTTAPGQFLIHASNGVGIGTNNPSAALEVASASSQPQLRLDQQLNDYSRIRLAGYTNAYWDIAVQKTMNFFCNSNALNVLVLNPNGSAIFAGTVTANGVLLTSDRNAKENFQHLDAQTVLAKVAALPVTEWNYKSDEAAQKHIGPMAQDFQAAFQLSADDKHISVVDEGGVALAAIQGLNQKVDDKDATIQQQSAEIADLKARLEKLEQVMTEKLGGAK